MTMKKVLLIGATGNLGGLIADALLARGAAVRLLVQPRSRSKLSARMLSAAEVTENEGTAFDGIDSVVSAVQGGPETIVDSQLRWLRAGREAGIRRFIPSDYSFNFLNLADGENVNSDWRRRFAREASLERGAVEVVHVMNGCFLDARVLFGFLGMFDLQAGEAYQWGDGQAPMEFTTYADTAAYTAEAALDARPLTRDFFVAGERCNFAELVREIEAGLKRSLRIVNKGSLADLDARIAEGMAANPNDFSGWLPLMYIRGMVSGKGRLGDLRNNDYPAIRPVGVRQYVASTYGG